VRRAGTNGRSGTRRGRRPGAVGTLARHLAVTAVLAAGVLAADTARAEPIEPVEEPPPTWTTGDDLPGAVGDLLELRLAAQEAITIAELARADAERERLTADRARFDATVARLRARHAREVLDRWAASLHRNEIGINALVELAGGDLREPGRVLDAARWLGAVGHERGRAVTEAETLRARAETLEMIATASLARAEDAERRAAERRAEADVILESTESVLRAAVGPDFRHQLTVGPDGCPTGAPPGTVRDGESDGIAAACARSVALAPTPEAALAVKYAFRTLGAEYACDGAGRGLPMRYDCSSLVARAYAEGGGLLTATDTWIPTTRDLLPWDGARQVPWVRAIEPDEALPGDLVLYDTGRPGSRHVVMLLADDRMLHVAECGDVSHVTGFWGFADADGRRYLGVRRVDPTIARDPSVLPDAKTVGEAAWLADDAGSRKPPDDALTPDTDGGLFAPSDDALTPGPGTTAGEVDSTDGGTTRVTPDGSWHDHEAERMRRRHAMFVIRP